MIVKERGMPFSGPLVRAILDGRKTETRRPVTRSSSRVVDGDGRKASWPDLSNCVGDETLFTTVDDDLAPDGIGERWVSPQWEAGEKIWVRETWLPIGTGADGSVLVRFNADSMGVRFDSDKAREWMSMERERASKRKRRRKGNWPSIHMPKWASRIDLLVTDVRAERVQDITEAGALAEGIQCGVLESIQAERRAFANLWDQIYRDRVNGAGESLGLGWAANPWVWLIKFEVVS